MPSPTAVRAPRAPLPPLARRLLLATAVSALGNGLVLPFLVVYLHQVRGMPTSVAGLVVAFQAVLGFVVAPVGGALIDRVGPRPVMIVAPLVMALGSLAYSMVRTPVQALGAAFLLALGGAALWPAGATMVSRLVGEEQRSRAFGIQFMLLNLGIGIGGLVAGLVVDVSRPRTFELLYVGDAVTFVAYALIMSTFVGVGGALPQDPSGEDPTGGYVDVLRDRAMVRLSIVSLLLLSSGYGASRSSPRRWSASAHGWSRSGTSATRSRSSSGSSTPCAWSRVVPAAASSLWSGSSGRGRGCCSGWPSRSTRTWWS